MTRFYCDSGVATDLTLKTDLAPSKKKYGFSGHLFKFA